MHVAPSGFQFAFEFTNLLFNPLPPLVKRQALFTNNREIAFHLKDPTLQLG